MKVKQSADCMLVKKISQSCLELMKISNTYWMTLSSMKMAADEKWPQNIIDILSTTLTEIGFLIRKRDVFRIPIKVKANDDNRCDLGFCATARNSPGEHSLDCLDLVGV